MNTLTAALAAIATQERLATQERKQVNYDYLIEVGGLDVEAAIRRIISFRQRTWVESIRRQYNPDIRYILGDRSCDLLVIADRENIFNRPERLTLPEGFHVSSRDVLKPFRTRAHIAALVGRCLAGFDVPDDVRVIVDGCGLKITNPKHHIYGDTSL